MPDRGEDARPADGDRVRPLPALLAVLLGCGILFGIAEAWLRIEGHEPWSYRRLARGEPGLHRPHPELGWKNKTGTFYFRKVRPPTRMTFWKPGRRATGAVPGREGPVILLLGGSFTQAWAVKDEETFGWRMQESFPDLAFVNLGTAAYGTYQSLLVFESWLAETDETPELVIYGFNDFHEERNVASPRWLRGLTQLADFDIVRIPYVTVDDDERLERHPPLGYPSSPFRQSSAAITFVEEGIFDLVHGFRVDQERDATRALLLELDRTTREAGSRLVVMIQSELREGARAEYQEFLTEHGVDSVDCTHPHMWDLSMMNPGYGHPNATVNLHWMLCMRPVVSAATLAKPQRTEPGSR